MAHYENFPVASLLCPPRLRAPIVPNMGWSTVTAAPGGALLAGVEDEHFYFVHSYGVDTWDPTPSADVPGLTAPRVTWSEHGSRFVAAVEDGPLSATQFHPEKSGYAGLQLLRNWLETL